MFVVGVQRGEGKSGGVLGPGAQPLNLLPAQLRAGSASLGANFSKLMALWVWALEFIFNFFLISTEKIQSFSVFSRNHKTKFECDSLLWDQSTFLQQCFRPKPTVPIEKNRPQRTFSPLQRVGEELASPLWWPLQTAASYSIPASHRSRSSSPLPSIS